MTHPVNGHARARPLGASLKELSIYRAFLALGVKPSLLKCPSSLLHMQLCEEGKLLVIDRAAKSRVESSRARVNQVPYEYFCKVRYRSELE